MKIFICFAFQVTFLELLKYWTVIRLVFWYLEQILQYLSACFRRWLMEHVAKMSCSSGSPDIPTDFVQCC